MCLVGENNAGKSNILKAIDFLLGENYPTNISKENIFNNDEDLEVDIQIYFSLTVEEKEGVNKYRRYPNYDVLGMRFWKKAIEDQGTDKKADNVEYRLITNNPNEQYRYEYISGEIRQILGITYIGSNRDIERHLGYSSKWTFMSKLADKFEQELERMEKDSIDNSEEGLKTRIQRTFKAVEDQFKEVEKFSTFDSSVSEYFSQHLPKNAEENRFDVTVSFRAFNPITYFKSLSLIPRDNGRDIDLLQLGDGMKTILLISYFKAYAEAFKNSSILMIEEPEIYLHPHLRRHIFDMFSELAEKNDVQVFYTTHSPDFIDVSKFENISIVIKNDRKTEVRQAVCEKVNSSRDNDLLKHVKKLMSSFGQSEDPTSDSVRERLRLFYRLEQNEAFFAKKIVLVEGQTEFFSLPIYAKAHNFSFNKEGITIVNCGAKNNIPYFYCLFNKCFELPTFVIIDGDKSKVEANEPTKRQNPALNRYLQAMLGIENPTDTLDKNYITQDYAFFSEDFENFIKSQFKSKEDYETLRSEAKSKYGGKAESKWFVQRYIASEITKESEKETYKYHTGFEELKDVIKYIFNVRENNTNIK